jgi:CSLREA domain-containing protein
MMPTVTPRSRNPRSGSPWRRPMVAAIGIAVIFCSLPVSADLHTVTELTDGNDGTCDAHCTLREAIAAANTGPDVDFIVLPEGTLLLTDPDGPLHIYTSVFLSGQGQEVTIVDASGLGHRAFDISAAGITVAFTSFTITGGSPTDSGGAIMAWAGTVSLSDIGLRDNTTQGAGGGIASGTAQLTVTAGSVLTRNHAPSFGGGGISGNDVAIIDSVISQNSAGEGGGVSNAGTLTISGSTIAYNSDHGFDGGGIAFFGTAADISNTTIVGNTSTRRGGAVYASGPLSLNGVTIHGNLSPTSSDLYANNATITVTNTLIAGDCTTEASGSFLSNGGNLESPGDTCGLTAVLDLIAVDDPMVWPLNNFGGSTTTMLPRSGSPAVGAGSNVYCLPEDQRGVLRSDGACDVGAVERLIMENDPVFADGFEIGTTGSWQ